MCLDYHGMAILAPKSIVMTLSSRMTLRDYSLNRRVLTVFRYFAPHRIDLYRLRRLFLDCIESNTALYCFALTRQFKKSAMAIATVDRLAVGCFKLVCTSTGSKRLVGHIQIVCGRWAMREERSEETTALQ